MSEDFDDKGRSAGANSSARRPWRAPVVIEPQPLSEAAKSVPHSVADSHANFGADPSIQFGRDS